MNKIHFFSAAMLLIATATLLPMNSVAQSADDTVQHGRLICTKITRLRWDCRVDGNDAQPSGQWTISPPDVANIFNETLRTASVFCEPINFGVSNGQLVKREQQLVLITTYVLGPTTGLTRGVQLVCDSGEPAEETMLAYTDVVFPNGTFGCSISVHPYLAVQCGLSAGLECTCGGTGGVWTCRPEDDGGEPGLEPW